jgi:hypothetical protein
MRSLELPLAVGAALPIAGSLSWKAEATSAVKSETLPAMVKKFSLIDKATCNGWGKYCPPGSTWKCGPYRCACRPLLAG